MCGGSMKNWADYLTVCLDGRQYSPQEVTAQIGQAEFTSRPVWQQKVFSFLAEWWSENDFIIQKTSGSTGIAKKIQLSKQAMVASAARTCNYFDLTEKSRAVLCLSADYIAGKMMLVRAIVSGMDLITVAPEGRPYQGLSGNVDFIAMVPLQAENMFADWETVAGDLRVKKVLLGGAQVSKVLEERIAEQSDTEFYLGYGMTETCSHVALRQIGCSDSDDFYSVMDGVTIALDDRGCIIIDDKNVCDELLVTNDLAELDPNDSDRFRWLGRYDNVINSGGIKFSPEELEEKVAHLIAKPFIFSSMADERLGQKIILIIEDQVTTCSLLHGGEQERLLEKLKVSLPEFAAPKEILLVPELAKTANGKIDRLFTYNIG